jgi:hypothetical protein
MVNNFEEGQGSQRAVVPLVMMMMMMMMMIVILPYDALNYVLTRRCSALQISLF